MFFDAVTQTYRETAELVGICDISQIRMNYHNQRIQSKAGYSPVPTYPAARFDDMIRETKPDVVIVTTMDCTHHTYIIRAMELGCDAISEKPMTTDAEKANAIFDAIHRTGKKLRVTFNYRYMPSVTKIRELILSGAIGKPRSVEFSWMLDTSHGADYFRRWHSQKECSGGLLVHKATHHFDLINWWIDSYPKTVFAMGDLYFYGKKAAAERGEKYSYDRYTGVEAAKNDPFALILDEGNGREAKAFTKGDALKRLYLDAEQETGYLRDRNVFGDHVNIEDTMAVMARYRNGIILNYNLVAYSPWEGYQMSIMGTKGRLEFVDRHGSHIIRGQSDEDLAAEQNQAKKGKSLRIFPLFKPDYEVQVPEGTGGHGGGDRIMLEQIFSDNPPADPFNRAASHIDGAASILMGISANQSIATGMPVNCDDLIKHPTHS